MTTPPVVQSMALQKTPVALVFHVLTAPDAGALAARYRARLGQPAPAPAPVLVADARGPGVSVRFIAEVTNGAE